MQRTIDEIKEQIQAHKESGAELMPITLPELENILKALDKEIVE